jgi:hypothetical protein
VAFSFGRRSRRDLQDSHGLLSRALAAPLGDVRRYRDHGAAHLRSDHTVIDPRELSRHPVCHDHNVARAVPHLELPEIVHQ